MKPVIELKNVTIAFDEDVILKEVNLTINEHEILILIGPSGSGKTVLLKTMAGIYKPTKGEVYCEGENLETISPIKKHKLAEHLGMQFQKSALFDSMTCYDNIAFPLLEQGHFSEEDVDRRVRECLEAVNLTSSANLYPHQISGGMRQRLGIARAIAMKPNIVFYDDPTAGLDPIHADKIVELILDLKKKENSTLIIVTHSMDVAYRLNGTIALVADQGVLIVGNREQTEKSQDARVQQFIHGWLKGPLTPES
ncbi:MAG: putative ribonucleotide transport atp-binding protein [Pseudomonadota bacterium]|jgi:phospholipid/cholesterol/gamma-HCH transport system ATP-binding protein